MSSRLVSRVFAARSVTRVPSASRSYAGSLRWASSSTLKADSTSTGKPYDNQYLPKDSGAVPNSSPAVPLGGPYPNPTDQNKVTGPPTSPDFTDLRGRNDAAEPNSSRAARDPASAGRAKRDATRSHGSQASDSDSQTNTSRRTSRKSSAESESGGSDIVENAKTAGAAALGQAAGGVSQAASSAKNMAGAAFGKFIDTAEAIGNTVLGAAGVAGAKAADVAQDAGSMMADKLKEAGSGLASKAGRTVGQYASSANKDAVWSADQTHEHAHDGPAPTVLASEAGAKVRQGAKMAKEQAEKVKDQTIGKLEEKLQKGRPKEQVWPNQSEPSARPPKEYTNDGTLNKAKQDQKAGASTNRDEPNILPRVGGEADSSYLKPGDRDAGARSYELPKESR